MDVVSVVNSVVPSFGTIGRMMVGFGFGGVSYFLARSLFRAVEKWI